MWKKREFQTLLLTLEDKTVFYTVRVAKQNDHEVQKLTFSARHICLISFNLNKISEQRSVENCRFKKAQVALIAGMIDWNRVLGRNRYECDPITEKSFVMHKIGTCDRWSDFKKTYGRLCFHMSEIM